MEPKLCQHTNKQHHHQQQQHRESRQCAGRRAADSSEQHSSTLTGMLAALLTAVGRKRFVPAKGWKVLTGKEKPSFNKGKQAMKAGYLDQYARFHKVCCGGGLRGGGGAGAGAGG